MFTVDKRAFVAATWSDQGDRNVNEDAVKTYQTDQRQCYVLCDGLGGHGMGDIASQLVVDSVCKSFEQTKRSNMQEILTDAVITAQEDLREDQKKRHAEQKMKTTVAVLAMDQKKAYIAHIGDSRVYAFSKKGVLLQTKDHSVPQMLVQSKEIRPDDIRFHPDRNILLKVMGIEWSECPLEFEKDLNLKKCEAFLLCSDGFWELLTETEMMQTLFDTVSAEEWLKKMNELVKTHGTDVNMDNYSAIAIRKE